MTYFFVFVLQKRFHGRLGGFTLYQINDYVMCGENGVCKVIEIGTPPIGGIDKEKDYYFLEPIKGKTNIIYSPVGMEKKTLRYVIEKKDAKKLLEEIENLEVVLEKKDNTRKEQYKQALSKYDCHEWMGLIKSVYYKKKELTKRGKKLHSIDMIYLTKLESLLYGELAFSMNMSKEEVMRMISEKLEKEL